MYVFVYILDLLHHTEIPILQVVNKMHISQEQTNIQLLFTEISLVGSYDLSNCAALADTTPNQLSISRDSWVAEVS